MKYLLMCFAIATFSSINAQNVKLVKKWETEALLKVPEAALYDLATKLIYVSNIDGKPWEKDGKGSIGTVNLSGKIEKVEWVTGLDAPKGLGIYKGKLYVADIARVVVIDIKKASIEKTIEVEGCQNLNDVTVDKDGNIYISDSGNKKIFILKDGKASLWLENTEWQRPNGLLALENTLRMIDMGAGTFYDISYIDKSQKATTQSIPSGDGIVQLESGQFLISNWNGEVNLVTGDKMEKLLDTKEAKINAADIWYIPSEKLLLVPTFFGNTVAAYKVEAQ